MAIPVKDVLLVEWSTNTNTRLTAAPATYGTTAAVALHYDGLHSSFLTAYENLLAARAAGVRSRPLASIKDDAKRDLLAFARPLYKQIQANTAVTDAAKIELGVHVPDVEPSPQGVPSFAPKLFVEKVDGRLVTVRVADPADDTRKRMPAGCDGATILSFVGETAPTNPAVYKYEGSTSRVTVDILFPETVEPGTQVWLTAFFFNERKQNGPACTAVGAVINYGGTMPMAA